MWWLENASYPIEVLDKNKVKVLVRSEELKRRYKHDAVIISFEWGKGIVYHMISHFYLQRSETRTKKQGLCAWACMGMHGHVLKFLLSMLWEVATLHQSVVTYLFKSLQSDRLHTYITFFFS